MILTWATSMLAMLYSTRRGSGGGGYTQLFYGFHLWAQKTRKVFQQCVMHRKKNKNVMTISSIFQVFKWDTHKTLVI